MGTFGLTHKSTYNSNTGKYDCHTMYGCIQMRDRGITCMGVSVNKM